MNSEIDRDPLAGEIPEMLARYGVETSLGRNLRKGDAKLLLKKMQEKEATLQEQEKLNGEMAERIARINAEHELNMQYLIQFGVRADERHCFQQLLEETIQHGGLTLREAASLAHARTIAQAQSSNADAESESVCLVASSEAM